MPARPPVPSHVFSPARLLLALAALCSALLIALPGAASAHGRRHHSARRCAHTHARGAHSRNARGCGSGRSHSSRSAVPTLSYPTRHASGWLPLNGTSSGAPGSSGGATKPVEAEKVKAGHHQEPTGGEGGLPLDENGVVTHPIDPRFLTHDPFGAISFWVQPWRAYLDTWPSSTLLNSLGINFNVTREFAEPVAQLLHESGFTLARREIPWGDMSYENPTELEPVHRAHLDLVLAALKKWNLRPLILLNANSGQPGPAKTIALTTLVPALTGATTVQLDPSSAAQVVPGKTGFCGLTWGEGPDVLITSVNSAGLATLSRPLREPLAAGPHRAMTLRFAPFGHAKLSSGAANPVYEETMQGWLAYVAAVNHEATSIFGAGNYDLEVWNELTFGSQFLNYEHYYQPAPSLATPAATPGGRAAAPSAGLTEPQDLPNAPEDAETSESPESRANTVALDTSEAEAEAPEEPASGETAGGEEAPKPEDAAQAASAHAATVGTEPTEPTPPTTPEPTPIDEKLTHENTNALLKETVAWVRNPANGISPGVGISDGFASQTPFPSGALSPLGLTALSKHLYNGARVFPAGYQESNLKPLNALGVRDTLGLRGFTPLFIPQFQSVFPEYFLSALATETIVRDIAPITTEIYGLKHGREVGPAGGAPVQKWMTEYNLAGGKAIVMKADGVTPANVTPTPADHAHFQAKALMRNLVAMINKGLSREYYFAAGPGAFSLIGRAFYEAVEAHPGTYPGTALGGETMSGFREMMSRFQGPGPAGQARQLQLNSIAQEGNHAQFAGDGTPAHPTMYDRDVLAVLPFQTAPKKFVIPVYVMTRDLDTLYEPNLPESNVTRFDLPSENFTIKLSNLPETATPPTVSAYDPLRREATPAQLVSREGSTATFQIAATDYPRLLTLEYH